MNFKPPISFIETSAFYLKHRPHGQESAIVHLFSRELGPVTLYQKGFRSSKFRWKALFDFGQELHLCLRPSGDNFFLVNAELKQSIPVHDYPALTVGSFLFQLLSEWPANIPWDAPALYDSVKEELQLLSMSVDWSRVLRLQLWILQEFGLLGDHNACSQCQAVFNLGSFSYGEPGQWSFLCDQCRLSDESSGISALKLSAQERDVLSSWFAPARVTPSIFSKKSQAALQNHLNTLYRDWVSFKMTSEVMRVLTER